MRVRLERGPNYVNFGSAPRVIRTPDLLIRSQTLYPTELWARREERLVLAGVSAVNSVPQEMAPQWGRTGDRVSLRSDFRSRVPRISAAETTGRSRLRNIAGR